MELRDANQSVAELKVLKMEKEVASRDVLGKKAQLEKELAELSGIYDVKNKKTVEPDLNILIETMCEGITVKANCSIIILANRVH